MPGRVGPNRGTPWISDGELHIEREDTETTLQVGSEEWFAWLSEASGFYVMHPVGNFFCRKERSVRRGRPYWSAHRRLHGKVYRAYIGHDEAVTSDALDMVAERLAQQIAESEAPARQPPVQEVKTRARARSSPREALNDALTAVERLTDTAERVVALAGQPVDAALADDARQGAAEGRRVLRLYGNQKHKIKA